MNILDKKEVADKFKYVSIGIEDFVGLLGGKFY